MGQRVRATRFRRIARTPLRPNYRFSKIRAFGGYLYILAVGKNIYTTKAHNITGGFYGGVYI